MANHSGLTLTEVSGYYTNKYVVFFFLSSPEHIVLEVKKKKGGGINKKINKRGARQGEEYSPSGRNI